MERDVTSAVDASAAPIECVIAGKTLMMSPLTQDDKAEFTRWLQSEVLRSVRESFTPDMTDREKSEWRMAAIREAQGVSMASKVGMEKVATPEGLARLLALGFRRNHKDMTWQQIAELLEAEAKSHAEQIEAALAAFDLLNLPADDGEKKKPLEPPTDQMTTQDQPVLTT